MGEAAELSVITNDYQATGIPHSSPVIRLDSRRNNRRFTRFRVPDLQSSSSRSESKSHRSSKKISQVLESSQSIARSTRSNVFGALSDITEKMRSSLHLPPQMRSVRSPLSFETYLNHLDYSGRIINYRKYKHDVFSRGFDSQVRIDVWRMILNVFPYNASIYIRDQFMADSSEDYYRLKVEWLLLVQSKKLKEPDTLMNTFLQIKGDVDRTDRTIPFFSGPEGAARTVQLYDMLCMYIYCHPSIAYRQGMADFAGIMLYVQKDEAKAYMCFCALMERLSKTFGDSSVILRQMDHVQQLLAYFDPSLEALINVNKVELLFGPLYRWLMLEMKREFDFEDSLRLLEVQWVMARSAPSRRGVKLTDTSFENSEDRNPLNPVQDWLMGQSGVNDEVKVQSIVTSSDGRSTTMNSWLSVISNSASTITGKQTYKDNDWEVMSTESSSRKRDENSGGPTPGEILLSSNIESRHMVSNVKGSTLSRSCEVRSNHLVNKNESKRASRNFKTHAIPAFTDLGAGNPFLIFLCVSLLSEYRDRLLRESRSGDVIGVFTAVYQSGNTKHNVDSVLSRAHYFFKLYMHELKKIHSNPSGLDEFL